MQGRDYYTLREVKRHDCLGLLREAMVKLGPTSQTLGALRRMARGNGETFASAAKIADMACRSLRSTERDLETLVRNKWIKCKGRERRRTPTYLIDEHLLDGNDATRFAILPRCMAEVLSESWAQKAVFAAINSRDSLNEALGAEEGGDDFGRLQYSARAIAKDTGLSSRAIGLAKASLAAQGIITVDPAIYYREDDGRLRTMPDTLVLNGDYRIPHQLIDRSANLADCRSANLADLNLHHSADVAGTQRKSGGDLAQNWRLGGRKSGGCSYRELTTSISKGTSTSTAEPSASAAVVEEIDEVDVEERKARMVQNCRAAFGSHCPLEMADAIDSALGNGCTFSQLSERLHFAFDNRLRWPYEHRAGAIFTGISKATPDLKPNHGWPYL